MKMHLHLFLPLAFATALCCGAPPSDKRNRSLRSFGEGIATDDSQRAQPKLLRISGQFDGSGKFVFTRDAVRYVHKHWARPADVFFDGEVWAQLERTPAPWRDYGDRLDLTKAWVAKREGRDVIALEHTAEGFELYIADSPNGAAEYAVTVAIPRTGSKSQRRPIRGRERGGEPPRPVEPSSAGAPEGRTR
jgi:hypothetical protein